jgi:hypothetical protein
MSVPGIRLAKQLAVQMHGQRPMHPALHPVGSQFVGRDRHRAEGAAGLDWKKPKPLASSAGIRLRSDTSLTSISRRMAWPHCAALAPIFTSPVTRPPRLRGRCPSLPTGQDRVARADKGVRAALVHQRVGPERLRQLGTARLAHQFDVIDVGRAIGPLVGARQRRMAGAWSNGIGSLKAPLLSASYTWRNCGSQSSQSSSAACRVRAMAGTARQRVRRG